MQTSTNKTKCLEKLKTIYYFPFEYPVAGTLIYAFLAGIMASLAASLFMTPPLNPIPSNVLVSRPCTTVILLCAGLFAISSAMLVWISFELEAFKADLPSGGKPENKKTRWLILEQGGVQHREDVNPHKRFNRLWRLWILLAVAFASVISATILLWIN